MDKDFMKKQPVFPLILSMLLPMVISMLVNSLYNIIDSFFVAKISEGAFVGFSHSEFYKCCGYRLRDWH